MAVSRLLPRDGAEVQRDESFTVEESFGSTFGDWHPPAEPPRESSCPWRSLQQRAETRTPLLCLGLLLRTRMYSQLRPLISLSHCREGTEPQASGSA